MAACRLSVKLWRVEVIKLNIDARNMRAIKLSSKSKNPTQETIDKMKGKEYKIIGSYMVLVDNIN